MDERVRDNGDDPDRHDGRDQQGRFAPGQSGNPGTQWGTSNPPPKSPGRPRRGAWLKDLESRLEGEPRLGQALADRLLKIALMGRMPVVLPAPGSVHFRPRLRGSPRRVPRRSRLPLDLDLTVVAELVQDRP